MYLKACDANGKRRGWLLAGSVGLYVLALVSKASVMVLPLALVVLDIYPLRRLGWRWRERTGAPTRARWLEKIPVFVLWGARGGRTCYAQNSNTVTNPPGKEPLVAPP